MKEDHGQAWKEFREAERLGYAVPAQEWDTVAFKNPRIAERFGAAQQNPQNAAAHFALASTYFEEGLFRLAEAEFIKTLELEPKMAGAHFGLGSVYLEMHLLNLDPQLLEKARVKIEEALHIDPNLAEAHYALGYIYILTHDMVKAIEEHRILKGLDSKLANLLLEELEPSRTHSAILEESARQVHKELFRPLGEDAWGFSTAD
jgi:Tfp pilus assembly protein PilF